MSREEFNKLPDPNFKQAQYMTDGEDQEFEISIVEWDFEKEALLLSNTGYLCR